MTWLHVPSLACPSAPESEPSTSASDSPSPDTELWVTSSGTPSPRPLSWRGWATRPWHRLLSGMTSHPSTAARGAAEWISSLPASLASRSPQPAGARASATTGGSGLTSPGWSMKWDPASCSWRTSEASLPGMGGSDTFSGTWPTSGSMRSGACYPRPTLAPPTAASVSGSWPTATTADSRSSGGNPDTTGTHRVTLTDRAVRQWPTPCARDDQKSPDAHLAMKARMGGGRTQPTSLTVAAKMWPTPRARDMKSRGYQDSLPSVASGHPSPTTETGGSKRQELVCLNPPFVEWLMGWPIGWTDCTRSVTESFHSWLRTHSSALQNGRGS